MTTKPKKKADAPPMLFEPPRAKDNSVKAIADRAEARSIATRAMTERGQDAAKDVDLKPLPPLADADEYYAHASAWISGAHDINEAGERWKDEAVLRDRLGVTQKQHRLLKAGLDGRCNRLKAGL